MLLRSTDVKEIMQARTLISKAMIGKTYFLVVEKISSETNFLNKEKMQIYESKAPYPAMTKKIIFCKSNSDIEMQKIENKDILHRALKLEHEMYYERADELFNEYLNRVQFRFSLLSKNSIYNTIESGHIIVGLIDKYLTPEGEFLTADSSTIRFGNEKLNQ